MTLSIGSTGRDFLISLVEIPVSHWSSLFRPENDADGCEVFEVTNHRSLVPLWSSVTYVYWQEEPPLSSSFLDICSDCRAAGLLLVRLLA